MGSPVKPRDPSASHQTTSQVESRGMPRGAVVSHGVPHWISRDVAGHHDNLGANFRGDPPWETIAGILRGRGSRLELGLGSGVVRDLAGSRGNSWEFVGIRGILWHQQVETSWVSRRYRQVTRELAGIRGNSWVQHRQLPGTRGNPRKPVHPCGNPLTSKRYCDITRATRNVGSRNACSLHGLNRTL